MIFVMPDPSGAVIESVVIRLSLRGLNPLINTTHRTAWLRTSVPSTAVAVLAVAQSGRDTSSDSATSTPRRQS